MKKKFLTLLLALSAMLACLFGFAACDKNNQDKNDATTPSTEETIDWSTVFSVSDGVITGLTDYGKTLTSLTIPTEINGTKIIAIGDAAFRNCTGITNVTLGENVTSIGRSAFYLCNHLKEITIPKSVITIGNGAFWGCASLTKIIFQNPNGWYYTSNPTETNETEIPSSHLSKPNLASNHLRDTYVQYFLKQK